jgi:hypothetical protein
MSSAISELENLIVRKREELAKVQADLSALERTLEIFRERAIPSGISLPSTAPGVDYLRKNSIPALAYALLQEAGKPLTGDEILSRMEARGRKVKKSTLLGALYHNASINRLFKVVASKTFWLLEDQNQSSTNRSGEPDCTTSSEESINAEEEAIEPVNGNASSVVSDEAFMNGSVTER